MSEKALPLSAELRQPRIPGHTATRFLRGLSRQPVAIWIAAIWLCLIAGAAALAPVLPFLPSPTGLNVTAVSATPSLAHPLGTDDLSRDLLARVIFGARASLFIGVGAVALGLAVGGGLGILAAYLRGPVDSILSGCVEVMLSFPLFVLAVAITGFTGHGAPEVTLAIAVALGPTFVRIARASTLSILQRDYVLAAMSVGVSPLRLLWDEVLPNVLPILITLATTLCAIAIVAEGSLSFLGVGIQPPTPSWGSMIAEGRDVLANAPHVSLIPAAVMFVTVLALSLIGERFQGRYVEAGVQH